MREASFASLDEARKTLAAHPLAGDYILDLLVDRGVMMVTEQGTVIGGYEVVAKEGPENPDKPKLGPNEWKDGVWPNRWLLMDFLNCGDKEPSAKFRWLQKMLKSRDQPAAHWITLHAIWHLMKHGFAEKSGGGYRLTEKGQDERYKFSDSNVEIEEPAVTPAQIVQFEAQLEEMGPEMREILDLVMKEDKKPGCTANSFSGSVACYKDSSEYMSRPEMRAGFSKRFVEWVFEEYARLGTVT